MGCICVYVCPDALDNYAVIVMRAYTVGEIDRMREAIEYKCLFGMRPSEDKRLNRTSFSFNRIELEKSVEERLRTYMLADITPEDLE